MLNIFCWALTHSFNCFAPAVWYGILPDKLVFTVDTAPPGMIDFLSDYRAINSVGECYLHTVEVTSSNLVSPKTVFLWCIESSNRQGLSKLLFS